MCSVFIGFVSFVVLTGEIHNVCLCAGDRTSGFLRAELRGDVESLSSVQVWLDIICVTPPCQWFRNMDFEPTFNWSADETFSTDGMVNLSKMNIEAYISTQVGVVGGLAGVAGLAGLAGVAGLAYPTVHQMLLFLYFGMQSPMTCMFPNVVLGLLDEHLGDFRQRLAGFRGVELPSAGDQENVAPKKPGHKPASQKLDELAKKNDDAHFPRWRRAALLSLCLQGDLTGMTHNCLKGILPDSIIGKSKPQICSKPVPLINLDMVDLAFTDQHTLDILPRMGL